MTPAVDTAKLTAEGPLQKRKSACRYTPIRSLLKIDSIDPKKKEQGPGKMWHDDHCSFFDVMVTTAPYVLLRI